MASTSQMAANRANAQRSTGPKSVAGKKSSRRNALKHGLTAEHILLYHEEIPAFDRLRSACIEQYSPQGEIEQDLVERLASILWRLRRVPKFEAAVLRFVQYSETSNDRPQQGFVNPSSRALPHEFNETHPELFLGRALDISLKRDIFEKLSRYESHLMRQLKKTEAAIVAMQERRLIVVDGKVEESSETLPTLLPEHR